jgi:uncharacterized protein YqiB (DUF1249 family)
MATRRNIYEMNYERIEKIFGGKLEEFLKSEPGSSMKFKSSGFMDLNIDRLGNNEGCPVISMSHYYENNGDLVPDPDMEIKLNPVYKMAEALTYQDTYRYQEVYPEPGKYYPALKKDLNAFLGQWTKNIINQKFELVEIKKG